MCACEENTGDIVHTVPMYIPSSILALRDSALNPANTTLYYRENRKHSIVCMYDSTADKTLIEDNI